VVAALLAVSVSNVQQNPQATTNFYLAHIYQQLNGSQLSIPSSLSNPTEPFAPPTAEIWVNLFWFLSLVISLTCALLATLLQQWARRYLRVAYPRYDPHKQARIRAFYRDRVENLHIPWMIEVLPGLLHISLFLFFAGLSVFLFGVHHTIFKVVTAWIAVCVILYACLTFLPVIRKDSLHSTPLSAPFSFCLTGIRYMFFRILRRFPQIASAFMPLRNRDPTTADLYDFFSPSMRKTAETFAFKLNPTIDCDSLLWTFDSLTDDMDLEKFFEGLPRLCDSETGRNLRLHENFIRPNKKKLSSALIGLMDRTLPSSLVSKSVRHRRVIICTKVVNSTSLFGPWWFLCCVLLGEWSKFLECFEFGLFVQNWRSISDKITSFAAQCVVAVTISMLRRDKIRDERWPRLAAGLLNVSNSLLHRYITNGDSILLANAIFIVRRTVQTYSGAKDRHRSDILDVSSKTLGTVRKLDIGDTLPELQHEFCDLWNKLIQTVETNDHPHHVVVAKSTLKNIRKLYIDLHKCTLPAADDPDFVENPYSYSMCLLEDHRPALPIPDLDFDEPYLESPPTPNIVGIPTPSLGFPYSPAYPPTFASPYYSSSAPHLSVPPLYPSSFAYPPSHSAAAAAVVIPFPAPDLTHSHASNTPHGGNALSTQQQPPIPPRPESAVSSIHLENDDGPTQHL
jgi:hypothetical protein